MKPKDAASCSFDWFNCYQKERDAMTTSPTATFGEQTLHAALELSKNSWLLADVARPGNERLLVTLSGHLGR